MDIAHSAAIRVFCNQDENEEDVVSGLKWLIPFNLEEEKIGINAQTALGFGDRRIRIFEVVLTKRKHVNAFIDSLVAKLPDTQMRVVLRQLDSRVDDNAVFFVRFDKETVIRHRELLVTDSGDCYHVRIKIAAFPSTKEKAMRIVEGPLSKTKTI